MEELTSGLRNCFGCGQDNPIGLRLKYAYVGERCHIELLVLPEHCGYPGLMHGGVTCVLFDEAMYHAIERVAADVVTLTMAVDYRSPGIEGHRLVCEAWIEERRGKKIGVESTIIDAGTSKLVAEGRATYLEVDLKKVLGH